MSHVTVGENESFEQALRRFTRKVQEDGIIAEVRRREAFESPGERRRADAARAKRRRRSDSR